MSETITVNGETVPLSTATVAELLKARGIEPDARGVAVAVNGALVPRDDWAGQSLDPGDAVEIVKPFRGG